MPIDAVRVRHRHAAVLALLVAAGTALADGPPAPVAPSAYQLTLPQPAAYKLQLTPAVTEPPALIASARIGDHRRPAVTAALNRAARATDLSPALLHAVAATESAYNPAAVSPKGAAGLMQLMPDTARRYGVRDPYNPDQNALAGARYLKDLVAAFGGQLELALAAYNAGPGAVRRHGDQIPPYPETRAYVPAVLARYRAATPQPVSRYVAAYRQQGADGLAPYRLTLPLASLTISRP